MMIDGIRNCFHKKNFLSETGKMIRILIRSSAATWGAVTVWNGKNVEGRGRGDDQEKLMTSTRREDTVHVQEGKIGKTNTYA